MYLMYTQYTLNEVDCVSLYFSSVRVFLVSVFIIIIMVIIIEYNHMSSKYNTQT